tara:strand:- start:32 stop:346 length:315 start_codon:yes stop_codon:yes gene_type:complete
MKILAVTLILITPVTYSCDYLTTKFCGEVSSKESTLVNSFNQRYSNLLYAEPISCYQSHLRIEMKKEVDSVTIDNIYLGIKKSYFQVLIYNTKNVLIRGSVISM